ncbi:MAG TPA: ComEC/Rec2 family competence protein, partial [Alphaproteobacteria bacterium]|nr:ComEC/Rec2 family competence protein [Alphaproteobacteria bacterium]
MAGHLQRSPARWGVSATLLAVIAVGASIKYNLRLARTAAVLALICAGSFARVYTPQPRVVTPPPEFLGNERVEVTGHITNDGSSLPGSGQRERFDLETESIQAGPVSFTQPVGMRATLFVRGPDEESGPQFPKLVYGQRVRFTARLRLPHNFGNPGSFDYESYLHGLGISTLASVRGEQIEILPGSRGNRLGFWRNAVRRSILEHINNPQMKLWPQEDAPLFAAMI